MKCISAFTCSSYSSWYLLWQNLRWHRNIVGKALHKCILQDGHCPKDVRKEWTRQIKDDTTKRTQGDVCLTELTIQSLLQRCSNEPCVLAESQIIPSFTPWLFWAGISGNLSFVWLVCSVCFLHSFSLHETIFFLDNYFHKFLTVLGLATYTTLTHKELHVSWMKCCFLWDRM